MVGLTAGVISTLIGIVTGAYRSTSATVTVTIAFAEGRVVRIEAPGGLERRARRFAAALNDAASSATTSSAS